MGVECLKMTLPFTFVGPEYVDSFRELNNMYRKLLKTSSMRNYMKLCMKNNSNLDYRGVRCARDNDGNLTLMRELPHGFPYIDSRSRVGRGFIRRLNRVASFDYDTLTDRRRTEKISAYNTLLIMVGAHSRQFPDLYPRDKDGNYCSIPLFRANPKLLALPNKMQDKLILERDRLRHPQVVYDLLSEVIAAVRNLSSIWSLAAMMISIRLIIEALRTNVRWNTNPEANIAALRAQMNAFSFHRMLDRASEWKEFAKAASTLAAQHVGSMRANYENQASVARTYQRKAEEVATKTKKMVKYVVEHALVACRASVPQLMRMMTSIRSTTLSINTLRLNVNNTAITRVQHANVVRQINGAPDPGRNGIRDAVRNIAGAAALAAANVTLNRARDAAFAVAAAAARAALERARETEAAAVNAEEAAAAALRAAAAQARIAAPPVPPALPAPPVLPALPAPPVPPALPAPAPALPALPAPPPPSAPTSDVLSMIADDIYAASAAQEAAAQRANEAENDNVDALNRLNERIDAAAADYEQYAEVAAQTAQAAQSESGVMPALPPPPPPPDVSDAQETVATTSAASDAATAEAGATTEKITAAVQAANDALGGLNADYDVSGFAPVQQAIADAVEARAEASAAHADADSAAAAAAKAADNYTDPVTLPSPNFRPMLPPSVGVDTPLLAGPTSNAGLGAAPFVAGAAVATLGLYWLNKLRNRNPTNPTRSVAPTRPAAPKSTTTQANKFYPEKDDITQITNSNIGNLQKLYGGDINKFFRATIRKGNKKLGPQKGSGKRVIFQIEEITKENVPVGKQEEVPSGVKAEIIVSLIQPTMLSRIPNRVMDDGITIINPPASPFPKIGYIVWRDGDNIVVKYPHVKLTYLSGSRFTIDSQDIEAIYKENPDLKQDSGSDDASDDGGAAASDVGVVVNPGNGVGMVVDPADDGGGAAAAPQPPNSPGLFNFSPAWGPPEPTAPDPGLSTQGDPTIFGSSSGDPGAAAAPQTPKPSDLYVFGNTPGNTPPAKLTQELQIFKSSLTPEKQELIMSTLTPKQQELFMLSNTPGMTPPAKLTPEQQELFMFSNTPGMTPPAKLTPEKQKLIMLTLTPDQQKLFMLMNTPGMTPPAKPTLEQRQLFPVTPENQKETGSIDGGSANPTNNLLTRSSSLLVQKKKKLQGMNDVSVYRSGVGFTAQRELHMLPSPADPPMTPNPPPAHTAPAPAAPTAPTPPAAQAPAAAPAAPTVPAAPGTPEAAAPIVTPGTPAPKTPAAAAAAAAPGTPEAASTAPAPIVTPPAIPATRMERFSLPTDVSPRRSTRIANRNKVSLTDAGGVPIHTMWYLALKAGAMYNITYTNNQKKTVTELMIYDPDANTGSGRARDNIKQFTVQFKRNSDVVTFSTGRHERAATDESDGTGRSEAKRDGIEGITTDESEVIYVIERIVLVHEAETDMGNQNPDFKEVLKTLGSLKEKLKTEVDLQQNDEHLYGMLDKINKTYQKGVLRDTENYHIILQRLLISQYIYEKSSQYVIITFNANGEDKESFCKLITRYSDGDLMIICPWSRGIKQQELTFEKNRYGYFTNKVSERLRFTGEKTDDGKWKVENADYDISRYPNITGWSSHDPIDTLEYKDGKYTLYTMKPDKNKKNTLQPRTFKGGRLYKVWRFDPIKDEWRIPTLEERRKYVDLDPTTNALRQQITANNDDNYPENEDDHEIIDGEEDSFEDMVNKYVWVLEEDQTYRRIYEISEIIQREQGGAGAANPEARYTLTDVFSQDKTINLSQSELEDLHVVANYITQKIPDVQDIHMVDNKLFTQLDGDWYEDWYEDGIEADDQQQQRFAIMDRHAEQVYDPGDVVIYNEKQYAVVDSRIGITNNAVALEEEEAAEAEKAAEAEAKEQNDSDGEVENQQDPKPAEEGEKAGINFVEQKTRWYIIKDNTGEEIKVNGADLVSLDEYMNGGDDSGSEYEDEVGGDAAGGGTGGTGDENSSDGGSDSDGEDAAGGGAGGAGAGESKRNQSSNVCDPDLHLIRMDHLYVMRGKKKIYTI